MLKDLLVRVSLISTCYNTILLTLIPIFPSSASSVERISTSICQYCGQKSINLRTEFEFDIWVRIMLAPAPFQSEFDLRKGCGRRNLVQKRIESPIFSQFQRTRKIAMTCWQLLLGNDQININVSRAPPPPPPPPLPSSTHPRSGPLPRSST